MLTYAIEPFSFCGFAAEEYLKILMEKMMSKGAYCFGSVHFKRTRVPFLGQSSFFDGPVSLMVRTKLLKT